MRLLCRHGHYAFYPEEAYEIQVFNSFYGSSLVRDGDFYTFSGQVGAPNYSLIGKTYKNIPAVARYEGNPWDVMKANGFVFNLVTGLFVPAASIVSVVSLAMTGQFFLTKNTLIQAGAFDARGLKILSYDAEFWIEQNQLRVIEYSYE
jgi:hypothetical protein